MSSIINKANFLKLKSLRKRYTFRELYREIREKRAAPYRNYGKYYQKYLPKEEELQEQRNMHFSGELKFSVVVPAYETEERYLCQMIDSVLNQTYDNWELCLADGSCSSRVKLVLDEKYGGESRIKYLKLKENRGISENTNEGFQMAAGDYIGLLDHDDLLVPSALYEMAKRIHKTGADMLYSDEDKVSADLREYMDPHFKPDFNRERLLGNNYICHFLVVSRNLLTEVEGLRPEYEGAQDFDFALRCGEKAKRIEHIPRILYHWRIHPNSTAGNADSKLYAYEAGKRAVESCLQRQGWTGKVTMLRDLGFYQTRYKPPAHKTLGLFFWGKENGKFRKVHEQIRQELKDCHIITEQETEMEPDYILVCSREITGISADGISILLGSCARSGVAVTGAKTIRKGRVSQCGYQSTGSGASTGNFKPRFKDLPAAFKGYFRGAILACEVDAVTNELAVVSAAAWKRMEASGISPDQGEKWMRWCCTMKKEGFKVVAEPQATITAGNTKMRIKRNR